MAGDEHDAEARRTARSGLIVGLAGWAALAVVTAGVATLALGACGIAWRDGQPVLDFCPAPAAAPPPPAGLLAEEQRTRTLQARLDALRLALIQAPDCVLPEPPPQVAERPPAPDPPPFTLPERRPEPPPLPDPPPQVAERPPEPPADIPQDQWNRRDTAFLEGCWSLISPQSLQDSERGIRRPMSDWQICFDAAGNGFQDIGVSDGDRCRGPVIAGFTPDGTLAITSMGDIPCGGGTVPQILQDCRRLPDGTAECVGSQPSANRFGIVSTFQR